MTPRVPASRRRDTSSWLSKRHQARWFGAALLAIACANAPRPKSLQDASSVSTTEAVRASEQWAPQAHAKAGNLLQQAEAAQSSGKVDLAAALAEHALAAYQRAQVQSRISQAEQRLARAKHQLATLTQQHHALQSSQKEVASRAEAVELEYKVVRDAEPLAPIEAADPKREAARRVAARSIIEGARLLCMAASLLDPDTSLSNLMGKMDSLESRLDESPRPTPVDEAVALRSACLERLTEIRMKQQRQSPARDDADVLLSRLSSAVADARVFRDDRGVVVPIEPAFDSKGTLAKTAQKLLSELLEIARANPGFPLMVVVHGRPEGSAPAAENVRRSLSQAENSTVTVVDAGDRLPASVMPTAASKHATRLEFVFVAN